MYNLERHLREFSIENTQYAVLYSIWTLNKKFLPNAQNAISFNFPHYSLHENSHSESIIKNIELLLGEDRIRRLSPTDTWLILMSAYTHDLGMIVFNEVLEKQWGEGYFQDYLSNVANSTYDRDLRKAANTLLKINKLPNNDQKESLLLPLEIRNAVIAVVADYFRKNHHERSKEMILGNDQAFYREVNGFNMNGVPNRFSTILSEIAYGHGINFYSFIDRLEQIADGYGNDRMHPRFVAALLRLGDLLDVDDKRFNIFINKAFATELPKISGMHYNKHASVKHLLISPNSIEVTVDCKSDGVYREARSWFDFLKIEVQDQSREWANIAPANLLGMPPTISRGKIKILFNSLEAKAELLNLKFSISNSRVFEIFEGSAIYANVGNVFIRELVQNSIDASKIQLWKMIKSGIYDQIIKKYLDLGNIVTHDEIIAAIKFPYDIPEIIWEHFVITLDINWKNESKDVLIIKILDNGTGISENNLIRMTSRVGESRSADEEYLKLKKDMPFWLKPTGAFGIGLQSLFMVTDTFTIQTKADSELSKEIEFYSAKYGEYCRISKEGFPMNRGTLLTLEIMEEKFSEIYGTSLPVSLIENYDYFTDKYKNIYIHKLIDYIKNEFSSVSLLHVNLMDETIKQFENSDEFTIGQLDMFTERDNNVFVSAKDSDKYYGDNVYYVAERIGVGSELVIKFSSEFFNSSRDRLLNIYNNKYLVRGIPVDEIFPRMWATSYCSIVWNLESPESDKVLKISRDKFIENKIADYRKILIDKILPEAVKKILILFEKYRNIGHESNAIEYFYIELTAKMLNISINSLESIYNNYKIPDFIATKINDTPIKYTDFFLSKKIAVISINKEVSKVNNRSLTHKYFKELVESYKFIADVIYWEPALFEPYINKLKFQVSEIYMENFSKDTVTVRIYELSDNYIHTKSNKMGTDRFLRLSIPESKRTNRRSILYPLMPYSENLSINGDYDNYAYSTKHEISKHFIISPFKSREEFYNILDILLEQKFESQEDFQQFISRNFLNKLIPDSLIEFILKNSSNSRSNYLNKNIILSSYLVLITDVFLLELNGGNKTYVNKEPHLIE